MSDELTQLRDELVAIQDKARELAQAESDVKARIRDAIGGQVGTVLNTKGSALFEVTYAKRFDAALARDVLAANEDLLAQCSTTTIDSKKAKAVLPPAVYELCQKQSDVPTIKPKAGE